MGGQFARTGDRGAILNLLRELYVSTILTRANQAIEKNSNNQRETEVIACSARTESTVTFIKTGASLYIIIKEG